MWRLPDTRFSFPRLILLLGLAISAVGWQQIESDEMPSKRRVFSLPSPTLDGEISVEETLRQRRSEREFAPDALTLNEVSQLVWAAQGTTRRGGYRTAPSAGALYPIEIYVAVGNVESLPVGVYRYDPSAHALRRLAETDVRDELAEAALAQTWVAEAPVILVIAAVYERTTQKYGTRGKRYVHMEVGHVAQNVYLQSTALGLGTTMVGAFDDRPIKRILDLPPDRAPLGLMPVGRPRAGS